MKKFRPPDPLVFEGNLAYQWNRWKQFDIYFLSDRINGKKQRKLGRRYATTIVHPPRKIPISLLQKLKDERKSACGLVETI